MKREIIFRGLPLGIGCGWQYGYLIKQMYRGKEKFFIGYIQNGAIMGIEVSPDTIGQYTGLKDSTGKEIYEGDIVTIGSDLKAMVIWFNGSFRFQDELSSKATYFDDMGVIMRDYDVAVIGNIHDNPELLNGGEK